MRRRTQRSLLNFLLFVSALCLILYFNHVPPSSQSFAWSTVRYQTISSKLPEARGRCPGLAETTKPALVVARVAAEDSSWLDALTHSYHLCVYTADAPIDETSTYLQVPKNRGHEAMAYLTFMIDNYASIPAAGAVFVHGSRWAWHNDSPDYDNKALLAALNVSAALEPWGYHNMRCDWAAGTCSPSSGPPQGSFETTIHKILEPANQRIASDAALPGALVDVFGAEELIGPSGSNTGGRGLRKRAAQSTLGRGDAIRAQCCAQFVVARDRIWQHSREEYIALRQWLLDGSPETIGNKRVRPIRGAPPDDRIAGRILSYMWHILFLRTGSDTSGLASIQLEQLNRLACPRADECYCRLYGRCDLEGCTKPGRCRGQYSIPPGYKLPDDWAETHS